MLRYSQATNPSELYLWNSRLSKAYLEEIEHVEILLRNFISRHLEKDCSDANWFDHNNHFNFDEKFQKNVRDARVHIMHEGNHPSPDRIIASLSLGIWRFLLTARLEPTVWRALRNPDNGGLPYYPEKRRNVFENHTRNILLLRNRCSHQEPLIKADVAAESHYLDAYSNSLRWVAHHIDPAAEQWIFANSRVANLRKQRPG